MEEARMRVRDAVHSMAVDTEWWDLLTAEALDRIDCGRPVSPEELGETLGLSAHAAASLLTMLIQDGRVRIASVLAPPARHS